MNVFRQVHTKIQKTYDGGEGWDDQIRLGNYLPNPQDLPGDMKHRGYWTKKEYGFNYSPYSQFSCAVGVANVATAKHLAELHKIAQKYGKIFVFTAVRAELKDKIQKEPDNYQVVAIQETWMSTNSDIWICITKV